MNKVRRFWVAVAVVCWAAAASPDVAKGQIKVMTSGGFAAPLRALLPEFTRATGLSAEVTLGKSQGVGPETISAQLNRGVVADVVILSREGLDGLIAENRIIARSDIDLAKTPLGMSVRAGAPKPEIGTVDAFKAALLRARSVTFPSSTTGIYMVSTLFPKLGIAPELAAKSTNIGILAVARGDAEIAIQPVSELLHVPGTDFVGVLPEEIQYISVFSAARVAGSGNAAAQRLIEFLASPKAQDAMRNGGMEPLGIGR